MSADDMLVEMSRALGRIEARLDGQDQVLADLKADVQQLKANPGRRWKAVGKWVATVAGTVAAAIVAFKLKVLGR